MLIGVCLLGAASPGLSAAEVASSVERGSRTAAGVSTGTNCRIPEQTGAHRSPEAQQHQLFREHQGKTISRIRFRNAEVFDESLESENNRLYRFLNRIHFHTLDEVIASQLLFEPGDPLEADDVVESARLLRSRNYLADAYVSLSLACDETVEITVHTKDSWTTEPQISFGRSGGEISSGFTLSEGNLLGTGNALSIGYKKDADRSGVHYYFSSPHFLNSRLAARIGYSNNSDGEDSLIDVAFPFYSLRTPQAFGFSSSNLTQVEPIRSRGEVIEEYRHKIEHTEVFYGRAVRIDEGITHRLLSGITKERDTFERTAETSGELPPDVDLLYPWVEYQFLENEYAVYRNLDQLHRREDVAMGKEALLRVGYGSESWDNPGDVIRYSGSYADVLEVGKHHILRVDAYLDGRHHSDSELPDTSITGAGLSWYLLEDSKNRWFARLQYDYGNNLQPHEKLAVGGTVGVRGYPLDYQRGDQRYIFSLERRYFSDLHLFNLFRVGGVAFYDTGRAWGSGDSASAHRLSNVGVGLRISSSKAKIGHVIHLDVATPLAQKENASDLQWLMKAEQRF